MAKGNGLSKPPDPQSMTLLIKQLATLAMARQASHVDAETLKFFAVSLSGFHPTDLRNAIDRLCHTKREQGETAFPDLPTFEEAIISERNSRLLIQREAELSELHKEAREHPERYISLTEIYEFVKAKRLAEGKNPLPEVFKPGTRK